MSDASAALSIAPTGPVTLVTGTLAAPEVRRVAAELASEIDIHVVVLNIQVAALMTTEWVARKLQLPEAADASSLVLPGYCRGDLQEVASAHGVAVARGPRDVADVASWLRGEAPGDLNATEHDIEIIAEINHAPSLSRQAIVRAACRLRDQGADIIDVGCDPSAEREPWEGVGDAVKALRDAGMRVSIDTFHPDEARAAVRAGAELVLSVNQSNVALASELGVEVVAIPDIPESIDTLDKTVTRLDRDGVAFRIDPILSPIGFGFAASLRRYLEVRDRYPDAAMMMGIGNLTEMTAADSGGINALLIGFCQEVSIHSVLTTQVINWARTSVQEIDAARRLMCWASTRGTVPKQAAAGLIMLRDESPRSFEPAALTTLARSLTDRNLRIFADVEAGLLHVMNRDIHLQGKDPFALFAKLDGIDPDHAFYLGFEMALAMTALQLGKKYTQDEGLNWGVAHRGGPVAGDVRHHRDLTSPEETS